MRARMWNAPARPRLTGLVIAVLVMTLLAAASLAFRTGGSPPREPATPDRPVFTRRMATLPPIVVRVTGASHAATTTRIHPR